jgi:hypothetical protein
MTITKTESLFSFEAECGDQTGEGIWLYLSPDEDRHLLPSDAEIMIDGEPRGRSYLLYWLAVHREHKIEVDLVLSGKKLVRIVGAMFRTKSKEGVRR